MKVMTRNKILTYACYGDLNFVTSGTFKKIDETDNPLGTITLAEFKNNTNRYCDFEVAEEIGDAIDRALSDQQNEIEQFKLAYMLVTGTTMSKGTAKEMMNQLGIINLKAPTAKAEYVTKNLAKDFNEYHMDLLKNSFTPFVKQSILTMRCLNQTVLEKLASGKSLA